MDFPEPSPSLNPEPSPSPERSPEQSPEPEVKGGGIPGFPFVSIIVGLAIGVLLLRVKPPIVKGKFGL
jgi:hypothetical protein